MTSVIVHYQIAGILYIITDRLIRDLNPETTANEIKIKIAKKTCNPSRYDKTSVNFWGTFLNHSLPLVRH